MLRCEGKIERLRDVGGAAARSDNYGLCLQRLVLARGVGKRLPKRANLRFSVVVLFCLECSRGTVYLEYPALGGFECRGNVCSTDQGDTQVIASVEKRIAHRFGTKIEVFGKSKLPEVAERYNLEILGQLPINPALAEACDKGEVETALPDGMLPQAVSAVEAIAPHETAEA